MQYFPNRKYSAYSLNSVNRTFVSSVNQVYPFSQLGLEVASSTQILVYQINFTEMESLDQSSFWVSTSRAKPHS
jgi:hypothetical protein